ncbi:MAG: SDR family oxidoreductase [Tannerellaceae bacterium]|nr:SDR family oxidoreductase [Tannerellaceae bacterium]
MKTILVTGGAGFIGTHLCEFLLNEGNRVICMDNLYSGSFSNIEYLLSHPDFRFIKHDITEPYDIEVDEIYNLACPASPPFYQQDPVKTFTTSVIGTYNMLKLAKRYRAVLLLTSTSEVYGDPLMHPQKELYWGNVNPVGIRSCYDEGKRGAECLCMDYHRQYGVNVKIIRIFNTYGPYMREDDGRVISNFILQALRGEDITIYGDGSQTRSFQYIDDLISAMTGVMKLTDFTGPVNIGNPVEFTIKELAEIIIRITNSKSKLIYQPLPGDDPKKRKPDISLIMEKLPEWYPSTCLEKGLKKTIEYFSSKKTKLETEILQF